MSHPEKLGKYPITGVLGKGAMGVVYQGFDPVINRTVAIKTIHKQLIGQDVSGSTTTARFRNEARAVGRLSHPGIVAIYEYGEDETTAYIAMEYVEGRTLSQILAGTPRPPEADILMVMDQLLAALDCAHRAGVWHRDIKPANLIVTHNGQLKVTDFGIARIESIVLTQITATIGTPGYMAPEQYTGVNVDHRIDIFSAGVLLYAMLTGNSPFTGTPENAMYRVMNEHPTAPSKVSGAERPAFYDAIVNKSIAKDPKDRYASVSEFRAALAKRVLPAEQAATETTVIMVRPENLPTALPAGVIEPPSASPRSSGTPIPGWSENTLRQIEIALASFVGPMARVMVRQAAKRCADLSSLKAAVAANLQNPTDRQQLMRKLASLVVTLNDTAGSTGGARSSAGTTGGGGAVSAEAVAAAQRVLATHLGPIAGVIVKKAAGKAQTLAQFHELLADQAEGVDRERLLRELQRRPAPR